eukprot:4817314-Amphidinium_carterae.1
MFPSSGGEIQRNIGGSDTALLVLGAKFTLANGFQVSTWDCQSSSEEYPKVSALFWDLTALPVSATMAKSVDSQAMMIGRLTAKKKRQPGQEAKDYHQSSAHKLRQVFPADSLLWQHETH